MKVSVAPQEFHIPVRNARVPYEQVEKSKKKVTGGKAYADAAAFFGVAFFLGAAAFAFLGAVFDVVLVTRPDLVLPRTAGFSTTAGA